MKSTSWAFTFKRIFSMGFFRPFLCAGLLGILSIMSGFNVVTNYMIIILEESYSSIDPNIGPIIVGSLGLLVACKQNLIFLFLQIFLQIIYSYSYSISNCKKSICQNSLQCIAFCNNFGFNNFCYLRISQASIRVLNFYV